MCSFFKVEKSERETERRRQKGSSQDREEECGMSDRSDRKKERQKESQTERTKHKMEVVTENYYLFSGPTLAVRTPPSIATLTASVDRIAQSFVTATSTGERAVYTPVSL